MSLAGEEIRFPNWRGGARIFVSRPGSLVASLILAVVIWLASFTLLTFPVMAGYYYAVKQSKEEEYFIDLYNIYRTAFFFLRGIKRYFVQSYILGFTGILPALALYAAPVISLNIFSYSKEGIIVSLVLMPLWLLAFFLTGAIILYGFPRLITTNNGFNSTCYAILVGKAKSFQTTAVGFMLLSPVPAVIIHGLMVFSYPFFTAWAVTPIFEGE